MTVASAGDQNFTLLRPRFPRDAGRKSQKCLPSSWYAGCV